MSNDDPFPDATGGDEEPAEVDVDVRNDEDKQSDSEIDELLNAYRNGEISQEAYNAAVGPNDQQNPDADDNSLATVEGGDSHIRSGNQGGGAAKADIDDDDAQPQHPNPNQNQTQNRQTQTQSHQTTAQDDQPRDERLADLADNPERQPADHTDGSRREASGNATVQDTATGTGTGTGNSTTVALGADDAADSIDQDAVEEARQQAAQNKQEREVPPGEAQPGSLSEKQQQAQQNQQNVRDGRDGRDGRGAPATTQNVERAQRPEGQPAQTEQGQPNYGQDPQQTQSQQTRSAGAEQVQPNQQAQQAAQQAATDPEGTGQRQQAEQDAGADEDPTGDIPNADIDAPDDFSLNVDYDQLKAEVDEGFDYEAQDIGAASKPKEAIDITVRGVVFRLVDPQEQEGKDEDERINLMERIRGVDDDNELMIEIIDAVVTRPYNVREEIRAWHDDHIAYLGMICMDYVGMSDTMDFFMTHTDMQGPPQAN